jgi:hypothetical protein
LGSRYPATAQLAPRPALREHGARKLRRGVLPQPVRHPAVTLYCEPRFSFNQNLRVLRSPRSHLPEMMHHLAKPTKRKQEVGHPPCGAGLCPEPPIGRRLRLRLPSPDALFRSGHGDEGRRGALPVAVRFQDGKPSRLPGRPMTLSSEYRALVWRLKAFCTTKTLNYYFN